MYPILVKIARVTDYIVAYACKGNEAIVEEKKQMKDLIMGCQDVSGTTNDVKRIARKLLNKTSKDKVISKQECMCHLAKLDLFLCSESIDTVSISGEYRLCTSGEAKSSFLTKYAKRDITKYDDMSLHQYFHYTKSFAPSRQYSNHKCIIPHYVGAKSTPTFPVTEGYAKSVLILHEPWTNTFNEQAESRDYVKELESFLLNPLCPMGVQVGYERVKARYEQKTQFVEPTGRKDNIFYESFSTSVDESVEEIVALASTLGLTSAAVDIADGNEYFYGDGSTNWSEQHYKV